MRRRHPKILSLLTVAAATAIAAAPALAGDDGRWRDRGHHDDGWSDDHSSDDHRHDHPTDRGRLRELARALARQAHALHERAEDRVRYATRAEARALADLHALDREARRFRRRVEDRYAVAGAYGALRRAWERAAYSFDVLPVGCGLGERFDRVADLIDRIERRLHRPRYAHRRPRVVYRPWPPPGPRRWPRVVIRWP